MIEVNNLVKSYDGFRALDGISLKVKKGSVYGLIGPNGAGKSTLIRCMAGIYRPDSGEISILGENVFDNPSVMGKTAYIPDDIFYYTQATLAELSKLYSGLFPSFSMDRFNELLHLFKMDLRAPIRKFSKGMQKQAAFCIALACCPELMILDEPVDGLDPVMRRTVWSIMLNDVVEHGMTVFVSSHNLRELEDVCDTVGIMNQGKMVLERSLDELQENIMKIQLVLPENTALPEGLEIIHSSVTGRVMQLIIHGNAEEITKKLETASPLLVDIVPLSLEEIFIYELGGADSEIGKIIL